MSSQDMNTTATAIAAGGPSNSTGSAAAALPYTFALGMLIKPKFLLLEAQVIFSALAIIWLGAHGSLRRPPSAAPSKPKDGTAKRSKHDKKEDQFTEGLTASDAIMLPIMAGAVLIGLYYLIEWLQDPDFLNKCIRVYMSTASIASLGRLAGDALEVLTSLVFPSTWLDGSGRLYRIDAARRCQLLINQGDESETLVAEKKTPFPGMLSGLALSDRLNGLAWGIRHMFTEEWTVRLAAHGIFAVNFNIKLNNLLGFPLAILTSIGYYLTGWNILSNLLGAGFSYAAFTIMSPTSFAIGSMVLVGLFVYDIIMVFYTPYMIAVATKIDAPIKLVFQGSMLGLGDIVIPGLLMGLALRFDMYQYYQNKIIREPVKYREIKAPYVDPQSQWGDRFWTTKLGRLMPTPAAADARAATAFPKPYFYATVAGYALGMVITLTMLLVFNHGQPALLYLVPGVTGSVWVTALARGSWGRCGEERGDSVKITRKDGKDLKTAENKDEDEGESAGDSGGEKKKKDDSETMGDYNVLLFSVTAPRHISLKED
ncbi:signal peptide peptidase-domain-containing protein [Bombardia bombarda]|uniref:Signal peptide peptidase-domain-containing protein n=1 Tax=Bombardia bombarda TaxID=252184 RepID=A0AA39X6J2_9PEZI|nr:signal peptide peptidase-domain-containing protein [Bombardia bombarda]